mmetsp:Transcript_146976/g.409413  ORF Transcript_146976/g.409413 Transcript_146976/m.409413 type:complete len:200 (-) Transcript_146976:1130-1729(-)
MRLATPCCPRALQRLAPCMQCSRTAARLAARGPSPRARTPAAAGPTWPPQARPRAALPRPAALARRRRSCFGTRPVLGARPASQHRPGRRGHRRPAAPRGAKGRAPRAPAPTRPPPAAPSAVPPGWPGQSVPAMRLPGAAARTAPRPAATRWLSRRAQTGRPAPPFAKWPPGCVARRTLPQTAPSTRSGVPSSPPRRTS